MCVGGLRANLQNSPSGRSYANSVLCGTIGVHASSSWGAAGRAVFVEVAGIGVSVPASKFPGIGVTFSLQTCPLALHAVLIVGSSQLSPWRRELSHNH